MPAPAAVLDANVLFGALARDLLLRVAESGVFAPVWTEEILDEWVTSLSRARPDIAIERLQRTRGEMEKYFPESMTAPSPASLAGVSRAIHPDDRHVVAAALAAGSTVIVTENLRHFPADGLREIGIRAVSLDEFLCSLLPDHLRTIREVLEQMSEDYRNPPMTVRDLLEAIAQTAPRFVNDLVNSDETRVLKWLR